MCDLQILEYSRNQKITVYINGLRVTARAGQSVHAVLLAAGFKALRQAGTVPRGVFCGMGICYDCLVSINGQPKQRACMALAADQMEISLDVA